MHDLTERPDSLEIEVPSEQNGMRERMVVAPCAGRFVPLPAEIFTTEGEWVEPGQALARILSAGVPIDVRSPFRGWLMGMLALPGQPVQEGEVLFWLWSC
jgi:biotin carboxyl carrier protein